MVLEERVEVDRFLPSLLKYDDLLMYVVEEVAEVAIVVEAGEVEVTGQRHLVRKEGLAMLPRVVAPGREQSSRKVSPFS